MSRRDHFVDYTGRRFGRLVVVRRVLLLRPTMWECVCDCGKTTKVRAGDLVRKDGRSIQSCGCGKPGNIKHGLLKQFPREHQAWTRMHDRCENPNVKQWDRYGGRGIRVADRWSGDKGFPNFLDDMGPRPSSRHSIDRIDNDGHYEPGNCRWATYSQQARNKRTSARLEYRGKFYCFSDLSEMTGVPEKLIRTRMIEYGSFGNVEDALAQRARALVPDWRERADEFDPTKS